MENLVGVRVSRISTIAPGVSQANQLHMKPSCDVFFSDCSIGSSGPQSGDLAAGTLSEVLNVRQAVDAIVSRLV